VSAPAPEPPSRTRELVRFLELYNLGLNLPLALAFLFLAADGLPSLRTFVLIVIAFVAARNAGHSFNRYVDRRYDAQNPRTKDRLLASGRGSPSIALAITIASAAVLLAAAYFLNPLAFALAPIALIGVLGYSYTKRFTSYTTVVLGLVEAIIPAAVFIAVRGTLPPEVLLAVGAVLAWGTAFEMIHSLGDLDSDRQLGLRSLPVRLGPERSKRWVPILHAIALALFALFGLALGLTLPYYGALALMAVLCALTDRDLLRGIGSTPTLFRRHYAMAAIYLVGVVLSVFLPVGPAPAVP